MMESRPRKIRAASTYRGARRDKFKRIWRSLDRMKTKTGQILVVPPR